MFCYVYVLQSGKTSNFHVGFTNNLKQRYAEHNAKNNLSTKSAAPWNLIYYEAHTSKEDALRRENYLKTTQGHRALTRMLRKALV